MNADWFRRPTRFTHRFGETERLDDPLGKSTWQVPDFPVTRYTNGGPKREVQEYGESNPYTRASPIQTPSGRMANIGGPTTDRPQAEGVLWSTSTRWRFGPPDIDEGEKARK
jgi:hypothetical protein